jgi:hypothetical protein
VSKGRTDYRFPLAVYKPYSGKDLELSVRFKVAANQWHTLALRAEGDRFTVAFDGSAARKHRVGIGGHDLGQGCANCAFRSASTR